MRAVRTFGVCVVAISAGCALVTSLDDLGGGSDASCTTCGDGGGDAGAPTDCTLVVTPTYVRLPNDGGASQTMTVTVTRIPPFVGPVTVGINVPVTGITSSPPLQLVIPSNASQGTFTLTSSNLGALATDVQLVVSNTGVSCSTATFTLGVPGELQTNGSTLQVPDAGFLTSLSFQMWGGGGGGGGGSNDPCSFGGGGGLGGFVSALVDVKPNETLGLLVGNGGALSGGGGGCSEVLRGSTPLVVAPGGGGGGAAGVATHPSNSCTKWYYGGTGANGGANGPAGDPAFSFGGRGGMAGTQTSGGSGGLDGDGGPSGAAGTAFDGGVGGVGVHRGGNGGCGWFGGGGGGAGTVSGLESGGGGAGGGGSALFPDGGTTSNAPSTDAGAGGKGSCACSTQQVPTAGGNGRIIVSIP
jgi:hypothetical protein